MNCEKCGAQLNENSRFCPNCGELVTGEEANVTSASTYRGPMGDPTPVLVWGIVGLAFSCSFYLSLLGLIFSIIGLNKAKKYFSFVGNAYSKQARIGRNLSIAGVIVSAILIVLFLIFIVGIAATYSSSSY